MRLVLVFLIFILATLSAWSEGGELRFRPYVKVSDEKNIRLNQLVETDGISAETLKILKNTVIADAPPLGEQRILTSQLISEVIRKQLPNKFKAVRIPSQITIANRGYEISEEVLRAELISQWKNSCEACRLQIESIRAPVLPVNLKNRPWKLEVKSGLPKGSFTEKLLVESQDGQLNSFWVNGQLVVMKKVPVATRSLNMNFRLKMDDFKYEWRDVTHATDGTLAESEIIGQQVRFSIPADQVIWANSVVRERAVKRGDIVRVTAGSDEWQVVLQAVTEQDAFVGDIINVRNVQSKKIITGEVVGPGQVVVR